MFGDETFTKSGSGYKWHFGIDELTKLMGRRTGGGTLTAQTAKDEGLEELSIDLTLRSDGSVELKYTASTSINEEAALRIDYTLAGNSSRMTAKGTVQVRNVCDVTLTGSVRLTTSAQAPMKTPPAGALVIDNSGVTKY